MIQIPQKSYQLIIVIGFLLLYLFYQKDQKVEHLTDDFEKIAVLDVAPFTLKDSIYAMDIKRKYELSIADTKEKIKQDRQAGKAVGGLSSLELEKKYFKQSDSLMNLYILYGEKMDSTLKADKVAARKMKSIKSQIERNSDLGMVYFLGGAIFILSGLILWVLDEKEQSKKMQNKNGSPINILLFVKAVGRILIQWFYLVQIQMVQKITIFVQNVILTAISRNPI